MKTSWTLFYCGNPLVFRDTNLKAIGTTPFEILQAAYRLQNSEQQEVKINDNITLRKNNAN